MKKSVFVMVSAASVLGWISCTNLKPKTDVAQNNSNPAVVTEKKVSNDSESANREISSVANRSNSYDFRETTYLQQNWNADQRQYVYYTPQGSYIIDYNWALKLKRFDSNASFFTSENLQQYGYIPQKKSPENPDGLPVGFTKDGVPSDPSVGAKLGVTCAACHMADISFRGKTIRIDGGQSYTDFQGFLVDMDKSIYATYENSSKLQAFMDEVLGANKNDQALRESLKAKFASFIQERKEWNQRNGSTISHGYGRVDAVGVILNQVTAWDMKNEKNALPPDAPVSYPFIWNASQLEIAQYIPLSHNLERGGPLSRNVGEVLGVFGVANLFNRTKILNGACSSIKRDNLEKIENEIGKLWAPAWPEQIFGKVESMPVTVDNKPYLPNVKKGAALYQANCVSCHAVLPYWDTKTLIKANFTDLDKVGTDSKVIDFGVVRLAETGPLKGQLSEVVQGYEMTETEPAAILLRFAVVATILGTDSRLQCGTTDGSTWAQAFERYKAVIVNAFKHKFAKKNMTPIDKDTRVKATIAEYSKYKARPLNGIWSTAPFLHNGSVRNLYELLLTPDQRTKKFYTGCTEFDAVNVGIDCDSEASRKSASRQFKVYDTSVPGNSNSGHLYGTGLSEYEKRDLVEYLKTL